MVSPKETLRESSERPGMYRSVHILLIKIFVVHASRQPFRFRSLLHLISIFMFDGNHRTRRPVNYGRRKNSQPKNRATLLANTAKLRLERQLQLRKQQAARTLQRRIRGRACRNKLLQSELVISLDMDDISSVLRKANMTLRLEKQHQSVLALVAQCVSSVAHKVQAASRLPGCICSHWIISTTLERVLELLEYLSEENCAMIIEDTVSLQDCYTILKFCISPSSWKGIGFTRGYSAALQAWIRLLSISRALQETTLHMKVQSLLSTTIIQLTEAKAMSGTYAISGPSLLSLVDCSENLNQLHRGALQNVLHLLLSPSAADINSTSTPLDTISASIDNIWQSLLFESDQIWILLLKMSLQHQQRLEEHPLQSVLLILLLERRVFAVSKKSPRIQSLIFHCRLAILGDNAAVALQPPTKPATDDDSDDNDSLEEEDDKDQKANAKRQRDGQNTSTEQQSYSTASQLDRVRTEVCRTELLALQQHTSNYEDSLSSLARQLIKPELWFTWARLLFGQKAESNIDDATMECARAAFVVVLNALLQPPVTGLKPSATRSPLITSLALSLIDDSVYLSELLWLYSQKIQARKTAGATVASFKSIQRQQQNAEGRRGDETLLLFCQSVFADLFSHQLVALRDGDFLDRFSIEQDARMEQDHPLLAKDVVTVFRSILHDVYWTTPVRTQDFMDASSSEVQQARVRVFISGTKLWKLLYERWCRLTTTSSRSNRTFCPESAWHFPGVFTNTTATGATVRSLLENDSTMQLERSVEDDNAALASAFADAKLARVLTVIPHALPFNTRVRLFQSLVQEDKRRTQHELEQQGWNQFVNMLESGDDESASRALHSAREDVEVRRDHLYEDSFKVLNPLKSRLRKKLKVTFVNQHGTAEAGVDGGGVFREYINDLIREAFMVSVRRDDDLERPRLFSVTPMQTLAVNTTIPRTKDRLEEYAFLGRVLGKAMYENTLVDPQFCLPFLNQLLGNQNSLEDLKNYDEEYYTNLVKLVSLGEMDIEGLGLMFEVTKVQDGKTMSSPLIPNGENVPVTKQNVIRYVYMVSHHRLNVESSLQVRAFKRGFSELIQGSWVRLFSAYELQKLVSGDDSGFDVFSLKKAMQYGSGYHPSQPVVQWFWDIVENDMTPEQQRKLLRFMTSCSRPPLLGFETLEPAPCLQQIRIRNDLRETDDMDVLAKETPLPTASTCMNLLKLPNYPSKQLMKWKLLAAIEAGAGFELS